MPFDIDHPTAGFSVRTAHYLARACELAYDDDMKPGFADLGLREVGNSFHFNDLFGFVAVAPAFAVVAFRGTDSIATWLIDGRTVQVPREPYPGRVHRGFANALEGVWPDLDALIPRPLGEKPVYVTGHSLGGALAVLAGFRFQAAGVPVRAVYTYGGPRVGNPDFAAGYKAPAGPPVYRVVNNNDLVPRVPPELSITSILGEDPRVFGRSVTGLLPFRYEHVGTLKYLGPDGLLDDAATEESAAALFHSSRLVLDHGRLEEEHVADHHMANYVAALEATLAARAGAGAV